MRKRIRGGGGGGVHLRNLLDLKNSSSRGSGFVLLTRVVVASTEGTTKEGGGAPLSC
jgi:hypothetical protein